MRSGEISGDRSCYCDIWLNSGLVESITVDPFKLSRVTLATMSSVFLNGIAFTRQPSKEVTCSAIIYV